MATPSARVDDRFRPSFPLVESKFRPLAARGMIPRTRLVARLADLGGPPVVSLVAPPGYGKTPVLAQWAVREARPVAWLTSDDLDNDPAVLVSYLAAALDRIAPVDPAIASGLFGTGESVLGSAVPRLASSLHGWERPAVLVIDDVHRLVAQTCLDALSLLLEHLPPGFRVAIAGRLEPGLPLDRLRTLGDLLELGRDDLALDDAEASDLLAAIGTPVAPSQVRIVNARTEGWAAGIYLAGLAWSHGPRDPGRATTVSGRDRYIADYLRSELALGLHAGDLAFLVETSILETVTPPIAEALTGTSDALARL